MASDVTYSSYLDLDRILSAQHPSSAAHDEMLFIIVHQASELWLKLCLHELAQAREHIASDNLRPAFKMLSRVARAQEQLIQSWDVLSTMTPHDYSTIRPYLGTSSGFQSWQYRMMEFVLGSRNPDMIAINKAAPDVVELLRVEAVRPSIYDEAVRLLSQRGFSIDAAVLERDVKASYQHDPSVEAAWAEIYRNPNEHWDLYELAEKLVDLEYHFQRWRFGHLKTVERIIGFKSGTGGTPGVPYLAGVLKQAFFPELLSVRTAL
ncbi:MAG TPA: tryptophan 2,3-dioxygenase [Erythrobacter sp.]|nr:tryptophan 2,3-dioxygenase [Erythrobacter sp.]